MSTVGVAQLGLGWLALVAAVAAALSPRMARWSWAAASLCACAWLGVSQSATLAVALAAGTLAAAVAEGPGPNIELEFTRLTRHLGLLVAAVLATVVALVRLAHVDASQASIVFPVVATAVISLVLLFAAHHQTEQAEIHRASRLLLVMAAVGWTVATLGSQPAPVLTAALALPLLGLTGRLGQLPAGEAPS